jgi:hypothetical protein
VNIFWVATATNLQNRRLYFSAVAFPTLFFVGQIIVLSRIAYQTHFLLTVYTSILVKLTIAKLAIILRLCGIMKLLIIVFISFFVAVCRLIGQIICCVFALIHGHGGIGTSGTNGSPPTDIREI